NISGNTDNGLELASNSHRNIFNRMTIEGQNGASDIGVYPTGGNDNLLNDSNIFDNNFGVYIGSSISCNITNNNITGSTTGLVVQGTEIITYNNFFNNTKNVNDAAGDDNIWNTTETVGTNIVGKGTIGGNFWANATGTGYSESCLDSDGDFICDVAHNLSAEDGSEGDEIDYLPLASNSIPLIVLNAPANNSVVGNNFVLLNGTVTDGDGDVMTVWVFGNETLINTTTSVATGTDVTYNWTSLSEGAHNWTIIANDGKGNGTVDTIYFTVDYSSPAISYAGNSDTGTVNKSVNWIFVNVSFTEDNVDTVVLEWNGANESFGSSDATNYWSTKTGLSEGNYTFYAWINDTAGNVNQTTVQTISVDLTAPTQPSVGYTPNDTVSLDPSTYITFNAIITESETEIDTIVLQHHNDSVWKNISMYSVGGDTYQANITTNSTDAEYTFNVWVNDSAGNENQSANQTFSSVYDCTWTLNQTALGQTTGWDTNKLLGNLLINNTGDAAYSDNNCNLELRLTYDITEGRVYFDNSYYKPSSTYTIAAGANQSIAINGTFLASVQQDDVVITANELTSRSNESQQNATATMVSTTGGPYLYESVTSSPNSVYLNVTSFDLEGYIRNLMADDSAGNAAYNVSFNWSVPSGWTIGSGNDTASYANISNNSLKYNNIAVNFTAENIVSLSPGDVTVYLYAHGYNQSGDEIVHADNVTTLSTTATINLLCYNTSDSICVTECGNAQDPDCAIDVIQLPGTVTSGGSSGGGSAVGGGSLTLAQKEQIFQTEETYEILRGSEEGFELTIGNPFDMVLLDVSVSISGFLARYLEIEPRTISEIAKGEEENVTISIKAPEYFEEGEYELTMLITGTAGRYLKTRMEESRLIKLIIHIVSAEDATYYFDEIVKSVEEMRSNNLIVNHEEEMQELAGSYLAAHDYEAVKETYDAVLEIKESAFAALEIIEDIGGRVSESLLDGLNVKETERLVLLAQSALERGDYLVAFSRADEARTTYALETAGKLNIWGFLRNNPLGAGGGLIGFSLFGYVGSLFVRRKMAGRKLKSLQHEEGIVLGLIKVMQKECFEDRKLTMKEYLEGLVQYEDRLGKIVKETIKQEALKSHLFGTFKDKMKRLEDENKRLTELIKKTQKIYMNSGTLETRIYHNRMKSYTERISEVEEKIAALEAKRVMKKSKKLKSYRSSLKGIEREISLKDTKKSHELARRRTAMGGVAIIVLLMLSVAGWFALEGFDGIMGAAVSDVINDDTTAKAALLSAEKDMTEMIEVGIPIIRYNDTLFLAQTAYETRWALENESPGQDYSAVLSRVEELNEIRDLAFQSLDELHALESYINKTEGINISAAEEIYQLALEDHAKERYERSLERVDRTYDKISEMQAFETKVRAIYDATSRTFTGLLKRWWKEILIGLIIISTTLFLAHNEVSRILIRRKINFLERRKISIRNLVARKQKEYFGSGEVSTKNYHIRIKKYGELVRDINRQIPLLKERLVIKNEEKLQKVRRIALYGLIIFVGALVVAGVVYGFWKLLWGSWLWKNGGWLIGWLKVMLSELGSKIVKIWAWLLSAVVLVIVVVFLLLKIKRKSKKKIRTTKAKNKRKNVKKKKKLK
ncbi:hypothetical protein GOV03_03180, partial [Candidatus Woesearchaeota archaeon]|nr:hypothetical protein [Candidatus Woesearchaeota archaeon]